jgi:hypothetical protein
MVEVGCTGDSIPGFVYSMFGEPRDQSRCTRCGEMVKDADIRFIPGACGEGFCPECGHKSHFTVPDEFFYSPA